MRSRRREPEPEPDLDAFEDGLALLRRDGVTMGHVATSLGHFRGLFTFTPHPWVWLVVVWDDGAKERAVEDYPPWTYVAEMRDGYLEWEGGRGSRRTGRYEIEWVDRDRATAERARLGIRREDF
ncbi:hypothetical protein [Cellulosimicrobium sp. NPDC055967]|uniref:hypothetical protein n=1 Tax=Cellulosimicrobium sp. NPDC055967 TaxID=3345670 RepID=UPI0035D563D7